MKVNLLKEKEKLSNKNDINNLFLGKKHEKMQINNTKVDIYELSSILKIPNSQNRKKKMKQKRLIKKQIIP